MDGYSRTVDLVLGCKTRNEFDAQPVSALYAQIDSFSDVTMSTFKPVTGVMINIVIESLFVNTFSRRHSSSISVGIT